MQLEADGIDTITVTFTAKDLYGNSLKTDISNQIELYVSEGNASDIRIGSFVPSSYYNNTYEAKITTTTNAGKFKFGIKYNGQSLGLVTSTLTVNKPDIIIKKTTIVTD